MDTTVETAPRRIEGVTVLCDFMRPDGQGSPGGVDRAAGWLCNAVKRQVALAAALPVSLLTPTASPALYAWVAAVRPPVRATALWAAVYAEFPSIAEWTEAMEKLVIAPLRGQFCVGYELPPYLVRLLDRQAIPYLDIRLHPIRFMDDLLFAVRASHPTAHAAMAELAVAEAEVAIITGLREAMCRFISDATIPADTLLVVGQRPYDCTQIVDGGFFDAMNHQEAIATLCARHRAVMLKPHPHDREHSLLTVAAGVAGNVIGVVDDNLYRLLALPEISAILTVSSSAAYEARYFGKAVHTLAELPIRLGWRGDVTATDTHISLDDVVLSVDFWRTVLGPHVPVTTRDGVRLAPKPNRLRIALDSFWNFNQIDTDRIPAKAA